MIDLADGRSAPEAETTKVSVVIPCRAEYVAIGRLAVLGVANRLAFSYDEVEDVRLAVGEACTHAVERALKIESPGDLSIWIDSTISPTGLAIEVRDNVPGSETAAAISTVSDDELGFDKQDLGALLMEILVDEVQTEQRSDGTTVRLFKQAPKERAVEENRSSQRQLGQ